jgi:hypothetical protein
MRSVTAYTIYHSPNAYLGMWLLRTGLEGLDVTVERRPIFIPRERGLFVGCAHVRRGRRALLWQGPRRLVVEHVRSGIC